MFLSFAVNLTSSANISLGNNSSHKTAKLKLQVLIFAMQRVERKNTSTLKLNSRIRRSNNEKRFAHVWFASFFGLK
jgi:hypothetical protein